eukprot:11520662-Alexandrium_andersonii.AAC.1
MSASLVGSEMCIRDRRCHLLRSREGGRRQPAELRGQLAALLVAPHGSGAVSYTHLTLPTICSV